MDRSMSTSAAREALHSQILEIKDEELRDLAELIVEVAPGSFWTAPASSSGKYHPHDERVPGGTVLHTARVMKLAKELASQRDLDDRETDLLLLAALIHDLYKGGPGDKPLEHTWLLHQVAPRFLLGGTNGPVTKYVALTSTVTPMELDKIWRAVETHEGRWTVLPFPDGYGGILGELLHLADYIASRHFVRIEL